MNGADLMVEDVSYYKMLLKNNFISDLSKVSYSCKHGHVRFRHSKLSFVKSESHVMIKLYGKC